MILDARTKLTKNGYSAGYAITRDRKPRNVTLWHALARFSKGCIGFQNVYKYFT